MEIILLKNVPGIGYKGDQVTVRGGYGRNYLIRKGLACVANKTNSAVNNENFKQATNRIAEERRVARRQKEALSRIALSIEARVAANGNIYGSIGPIQVAEALQKEGFEIDYRQIKVPAIKRVGDGNQKAEINFYRDITLNIPFEIKPKRK